MKSSRTILLISTLFVFSVSVFAQGNSYEIITHEDVLYGKEISGSIIFDSEGKLWMSGTGEIYRLDGDSWTTFTASGDLSEKEIEIIAVGPDGVVWCSYVLPDYSDRVSIRFYGETWTTFSLEHEGRNVDINRMVVDPEGVVWASGGYLNAAVFYYKDDTWTKTIVDFALGNLMMVRDLAVDPDGVIYVATNGGVYKYEDGIWSNTGLEGMEQDDAQALAVGHDGKVWTGSFNGVISYFDGESWTTVVESNDITREFEGVKACLEWFILRQEKEYYEKHGEYVNFDFGEDCDPIGWKPHSSSKFEFSFQDSIASSREKEDVNGDGDTADGLTLSVTGVKGNIPGSDVTWETMFGEGPSGHWIWNMATGSYGDIWVSTGYGVLFRYDNGTWIKYSDDDFQTSQGTRFISNAPEGEFWIQYHETIWQLIPTATAVETDESIPSEFYITNNYPNPFNPITTIEFTIPETGFINLSIYNIAGQKIRELVTDTMQAGTHSVVWDGKDENGMMVSSGIYLSRLLSEEHVATGRMLLMK